MTAEAEASLHLRYGSGVQHAEAPRHWKLRTLGTVPHEEGRSERSVVMDVLSAPIGAKKLQETVRPDENILVLVPDKTRRCRMDVVLPVLLDLLAGCGIPDSAITILFAMGTHPPQTPEERAALLGEEVCARYRVLEHDARDTGTQLHVGTTAAGTDIRLNRLVCETDRVIAVGTIVHHYFAGFGGGAKLFVPGVASHETAVANHRRTITSDGRFHPGCSDGAIDGNPVIGDIMDAVRFLPPTWYFATLLDTEGKIVDGVCGDLVAAHAEGCRRVDARYRVDVHRAADIMIVSTGGYPKDINFIQAHKSLHHAAYVTRPGGSIIFLAECREGIGNDTFLPWFDLPDGEALREALLRHYTMNAHT
ncbi:MAG: nickel-dependent lactate racemase, partial [Bacteroidota bacterium]|nr:nickel-dependent lactate racemase [Bacteroidota bacterium]